MLVYLNVGGVFFATSRDTLRESDSFFSGLVQNECCHEYFVDRDPTHFRHVLNWLRTPDDEAILRELWWEADYYALTDMRDMIASTPARYNIARSVANIAGELRHK